VRTLRSAAELLASADGVDRLIPIAASAGCPGSPAPLDAATLGEIGVPDGVVEARISEGEGSLRALMLEIDGRAGLREFVVRTVARLAARTPHVLWLLLVTQPSSRSVAFAAWRDDHHSRAPRPSILLVDRTRVVESDVESVAALSIRGEARSGSDLLIHARWLELLGRSALTRRFYRTLQRRVSSLAVSSRNGSEADRAEIALLYCSRLLFLAFLEAKGWLDGARDFLGRGFDACMASGGQYHRRVLLPLFFGTLNTPRPRRAPAARGFGRVPFLNGGLFARTPAERRARGLVFPDEELGALHGELFSRYRFTAREARSDWSELAVDPEMLGKAFESLMASVDRKSSGTFYTPHELVDRVTSAALARALKNVQAGSRLHGIAVLDPACGSGAFLVRALERLADMLRADGDTRALGEIRRDVLARCIFGVDRDPTAVWLCELRLWLSVVIESDVEDPLAVPPLPNLDRNIRVGDSLSGAGFDERAAPVGRVREGASLRQLRERYASASGARKTSIARQLDRAERRIGVVGLDQEIEAVTATRRDLLSAVRGRDLFGERHHLTSEERALALELRQRVAALRSRRARLAGGGALPFAFAVHFADVAARGGFDLVVGNPPWVRVHRIPAAERLSLRRRYRVYRAAAWEGGAERAQSGRGFAAQVDLAALFVERSLRLLRPGATLALLVPVKLWRSLAGGGVRRLLGEESRVAMLEDFSDAPAVFDAAVYPSLVVAERWDADRDGATPTEVVATSHRGGSDPLCWRVPRRTLSFDDSPGSPWLVIPPEVRAAFDKLRDAGIPFTEGPAGRPILGVKCGFNLAFVVRRIDRANDEVATIEAADGQRGLIEASLLRPLARGESLRPWQRPASEEHIIWTHDDAGHPLERLPPLAAKWFAHWRRPLTKRSDARGGCWWSLFRIDGARSGRPRVLWADLGRAPRATVVRAGDGVVPLNSCYAAHCRDETDALALAAVLNSPLADAWLAALAEPARGGYRRFLGWTMALLPLPRDWTRARELLSPVADRMRSEPDDARTANVDLLDHCLKAFGLRHAEVAPLLTWYAS
jgi:Eco57I restriction-modification methylase